MDRIHCDMVAKSNSAHCCMQHQCSYTSECLSKDQKTLGIPRGTLLFLVDCDCIVSKPATPVAYIRV